MKSDFKLDLTRRPRRLRRTDALRSIVQETIVRPSDLIQPLFVLSGEESAEPIHSMPGVFRLNKDDLLKECEELLKLGLKAVALFPKTQANLKTENGEEALNSETLILKTIRTVKAKFPELLIVADVALDPYTSHGHDGILTADGSTVDNDRTVEALAKMALLNAQAGADIIAPSDMMDGRVGAIREALDNGGQTDTAILAYSAKFSSAYYGPFRDAVGSTQDKPISKATYQCNPANRREAMIEAELDTEEGADMLMVKPAGPYLDIIRDIRDNSDLPIAAYQVSGEYAQIHAAARFGWLDLIKCRDESLTAIKRAGADLILTYFAKEYCKR